MPARATATPKLSTFKLDSVCLELLDRIGREYGLASRAAVVRYLANQAGKHLPPTSLHGTIFQNPRGS